MTHIKHVIESLAPVGPLTEWLDANVPALGDGPLTASVLSGGQSNVVLTLDRGEGPMVLRRQGGLLAAIAHFPADPTMN